MKNNTVRIQHKAGKKAPSSQAQTGNGKTQPPKTAALKSEPTMQVVFFKPDTAFSHTPECRVVKVMEIPASRFEQVKAAAMSAAGNKLRVSGREVKHRAISYEQVNRFIDDFQRLQFARDELGGLLSLGTSMIRSLAPNAAGLEVADNFAALVTGAKHKMNIAVNMIREVVYTMEPRVDEPWQTAEEMKAAKEVAS